ncbi:MAG: cytochrome B [Burkholderiales bacterium]|nr:MAG: cytochrome B [Burkholderiales bacterium]
MSAGHTVRIWDLPTRLFHWALFVCVVGLIITGNVGGSWMTWHFRLGYSVMTLLLFRFVWGLIGGKWSRFASFIYSPGSVIAYLKGQGKPEHSAGHNPLGAGSVFALLGFLALQVGTGLISDDEITNAGPLTRFVSNARVSLATWWHKDVGKWVIAALVVLHIAAILFYLYKKKENLIRPMIDGDKQMAQTVEASKDTAGSRVAALIVLVICAAFVYWVQSLGAPAF